MPLPLSAQPVTLETVARYLRDRAANPFGKTPPHIVAWFSQAADVVERARASGGPTP